MAGANREQLGEWLSAYLDGELDAQQSHEIEQFLREDADAQQLLQELRLTVDAVSSLPRHAAPDSIVADIQSHVERSELIGDFDHPGPGAGTGRSPLRALLSSAAVLVAVVGGWWYMTLDQAPTGDVVAPSMGREELAQRTDGEVGGRGGARVASRTRSATKLIPERDMESAAPARHSFGDAALLASASFDQKLRAGLGSASVRSHRFKNETVRLRVTVEDAQQRDAVTKRVADYLSGAKIKDLAVAAKPGAEYFFHGVPKKNFVETEQRQFLVRTSRKRVDGLLGSLGPGTSRVALTSGPVVIHGWDPARGALQGLWAEETKLASADDVSGKELASTPSKPVAEGVSKPAAGPPGDREGPFAALLQIVGLPDQIATDEEGEASSDTPADAVTIEPGSTYVMRDRDAATKVASARRGKAAVTESEESEHGGPSVFGGGDGSRKLDDRKTKKKVERSSEASSLVHKRLAALEASRKRGQKVPKAVGAKGRHASARPAGPRSAAAPVSFARVARLDTELEPFVTFVVQITVAPSSYPPKANAVKATRPAKPKHDGKETSNGNGDSHR